MENKKNQRKIMKGGIIKMEKILPQLDELSAAEANAFLQDDPEDLAEEYNLASKYEAEDFQDKVQEFFN